MKLMLTALGAIVLSSTVSAGEGSDNQSVATAVATFRGLDKNADRQISRTEAAAQKKLSERFAFIDTDGDGYVNEAEYIAAEAASRTQS